MNTVMNNDIDSPYTATSFINERTIKTAAIIGAGTMGSGIAMCFANAGIPVYLLEKDTAKLEQGISQIRLNYERSVRRGKLTEDSVSKRMSYIHGSTCDEHLANVDIVIEAVFEDMEIKKEVFKTLDTVCKPGAILASNTSYLDIDDIASATTRAQDVVGMHFFSPAHIMKLVEIVRGPRTAEDVCASVMALSHRLDKIGVLVGLCDGFVGNRILSKRTRESYFLLQEGASPYQVDRALKDFGFPMGPFAMSDLAGLDVSWRNRQSRLSTLTPRERECDILDRLVSAGRLGQKTKHGFYDYDDNRIGTPSMVTDALIAAHRATSNIPQREISDQEIVERCLYAMINEAAFILEEGIVNTASDIDVVWLHGYGFPASKGGLLRYADSIGLNTILEGIRHYATTSGTSYWKPADLLVTLATKNHYFIDAKNDRVN